MHPQTEWMLSKQYVLHELHMHMRAIRREKGKGLVMKTRTAVASIITLGSSNSLDSDTPK